MKIFLVPCSATKHPRLVAGEKLVAAEAYTGPAFRIATRKLKAAGARWFVLSAKYGFLRPDSLISNYDQLITSSSAELAAWTAAFDFLRGSDLSQLRDLTNEIISLGSSRYSDAAAALLQRADIARPIAGLTQGRMLAALSHLEVITAESLSPVVDGIEKRTPTGCIEWRTPLTELIKAEELELSPNPEQ